MNPSAAWQTPSAPQHSQSTRLRTRRTTPCLPLFRLLLLVVAVLKTANEEKTMAGGTRAARGAAAPGARAWSSLSSPALTTLFIGKRNRKAHRVSFCAVASRRIHMSRNKSSCTGCACRCTSLSSVVLVSCPAHLFISPSSCQLDGEKSAGEGGGMVRGEKKPAEQQSK
jgi:hypothetical protein